MVQTMHYQFTCIGRVFQAQGVLQEYLLAMTTDEQLLNHTAMVRLPLSFCLCIVTYP